MHAMGGLMSVQTSIIELPSEESLCELRRPRVILCGHILRSGLIPIGHRRCLEQGVADFECMIGMNNFFSLIGKYFGRECL